MNFRRIEPKDYRDICELNKKLGYYYDEDKVYNRIISILETGSDIISVAEEKGKVIGYLHGSPYEPLYEEKLFNIIAFVFSEEFENNVILLTQLFTFFKKKVKHNGYFGICMFDDDSKSESYKFLIKKAFDSHKDISYHLKYFTD